MDWIAEFVERRFRHHPAPLTLRFGAAERVEQLLEKRRRGLAAYDTVCFGPFSFRAFVGSEHHVDYRQVDSVVGIAVIGIFGVVPVVELWCHDEVSQGAEIDPEIRVDRDCLNAYKHDICIQRSFGEAKHVEGDHHDRTGHENFRRRGSATLPASPFHGLSDGTEWNFQRNPDL